MTRPLHRLRTQRALTLQTWLREDCPEYGEAEIRYVREADLASAETPAGAMWYGFNGSSVRWDGDGFMWRTGPDKTWTLIGFRYHHARKWCRSKARVSSGTPRKRPPSLAEVMDAIAGVVGLAGAVAPMFRR